MRQIFTICLGILLAIPTLLRGQTAPAPQHLHQYILNSGLHSGSGDERMAPVLAYDEVVQAAGVPWLRLQFSEVYLGTQSYLLIRSLRDGVEQRLNATSIVQWQSTSAYFNGDAVELQLYVGPGDHDVFVRMQEVMVGEWSPGDNTDSQCGPTDDRIPSSDPAAGRLLNIGCTAWIICDGRLVTAGHCVATISLLNTVEFNVPPSLPNGTIVHPGPEDQYAANTASRIFSNGGIGNDWAVFEVFANSVTGLMPIDAQGAHFELAQNLGPPTIRITGYGVDFDNGDRNQVQQTHAGPNAGSSGTTMRYQTDTEGGNSGSPVIDEATGVSVGVHTNAGCTTGGGGSNSGTSTFNAGFWAQVGNLTCGGGGGIPCSDITSMAARCIGGGTKTVQVRVNLLNNIIHAGEIVTITIDGTPFTATIVTNGTHSRANFSVDGWSVGDHVVSLVDPPGCLADVHATCAAGDGVAKLDPYWNDDAAWTVHAQDAPQATKLVGNYPNPFNPSTSIRYSLGEDTHVTLRVYNTLGQLIATLVNEVQTSGYKTVIWNGKNDSGAPVSSGLYIYTLTAGNVVKSDRMLFMK